MRNVRLVARLVAVSFAASTLLGASLFLVARSATTLKTAATTEGLPDVALSPLAMRSEIVASDGSVLDNLYEEDRVPISLDSMPVVLQNAVLATEDAAFFDHDGVSVRGVLRALRENVTEGRVSQGGSTITQQLVKNSLLDDDRTYDRKMREAVLAYRMEQQFSKREILEQYLNSVYFGAGAHGVVAASERFFGKPVGELTLPEAALLAGMISSPETYDPFRNPEAAQERRAHVLDRMVEVDAISEVDAAAAKELPLPTELHLRAAQPTRYFTEEVRRQLLADPRLGATPQDRFNAVFRGGIRVETTFDPPLQASAERAVTSTLPQSQFTASLVAVDPADGAVRALVGGPGFEQAKYNLATQGARQAGSSFKTIALAAWVADGRSPEDVVDATAPCTFPIDGPDEVWNVDNYDGGSGAPAIISLREATVKSSNCAYARMALVLGAEKIAAMAKKLGISRNIPAYPSIVLGTAEVSPLEMASVYATLAAGGVRHQPMFIRRVTDRSGRVLLENQPVAERVLEPEVARTVTNVLRGVVEGGTGQRAQIGRPAAGKTGTAQEWRDAWFAGYTPQLAASVWMGSPVSQESMRGVAGINVTGGSFPAQVWSKFMGEAVGSLPAVDFEPPNVMLWPQATTIGSMPFGIPLPPGITPQPGAILDPAMAALLPVPPEPVEGQPPAEAQSPTATTTTTSAPATTTTHRKKRSD